MKNILQAHRRICLRFLFCFIGGFFYLEICIKKLWKFEIISSILFHFVGSYLVARTKTFIRKRRRPIIDIGYGSYCTSFTREQKH